MGLNNNTPGLSQGQGLSWHTGLNGGPGLTIDAGGSEPALLLEDGSFLLLEDGGKILLES